MATLDLLTTVTGSGVFDHPVAPGSKYGLAVVDGATISPSLTIPAVLSTATNESLISLLKSKKVTDHINEFVTRPDGYDMDTEYTLTSMTLDNKFDFKTYMDEYNRAVSVDVTKVNLYVAYSITVTKDDDTTYNENIFKVICFVLAA